MKELLFLETCIIRLIWGEEYWTVSAHPKGDCMIKNGQYSGRTLSWLWENHRELFGNIQGDKFPLLVKVIDARDDLSIQVHPDNEYANIHENGWNGKTECWYVMDCKPDQTIIIGQNAKCREEASKMIECGEWNRLLREIPTKKGDFYQIYPGTVHAIKSGTKIMEIQQNSDITYRMFDYNRLKDGKPRELHIEKSLDVISYPYTDANCHTNDIPGRLVSCDYYSVDKYEIKGSRHFDNDRPFIIISVIEGNGSIDGTVITEGESFIVPSGYSDFTVEGDITIMMSSVPRLYGALEAGGTKMVCAVGYENGTIVDQVSIPTTTPQETMPKLIEYFKSKNICALGIGSFGPVDVKKNSPTYGMILDTPKLAWQRFDILGSLKKELDIPMNIDTDVNGSCLGEVTFGESKGLDSVLYLTIGTGVGAGISINGELLHGMLHSEAGHILLTKHPKDGYAGKCPFHDNCFEGLAAGPAIEERWGEKAVALKDREEVWELEAYYIAQALTSLIFTLTPRRIILGGGVMHQTQLFPMIRKLTKEMIAGYLNTDELKDMDNYIVPASLHDDQGIMGAIQLAVIAKNQIDEV